jgi:polysaccharide biosynthesis protein PslE
MPLNRSVDEHNLSKAQLRQLVRRYWLVVLIVFLTGTLAMYVTLPLFFTDLYESTAELLVRVGRENAETPTTVQRGEVISQGVRMADINSEVQMLSSRALVESVVDRLGPDAFKSVMVKPDSWIGYPKYYARLAARQVKYAYAESLIALGLEKRLTPREAAILRVSDGIKVEPVKDSDILTLKVRMPSPKLCMDVANALLDGYLQRRIAIRQSSAGSDFFSTGLNQSRLRLEKARQTRSDVRNRYNITDPAEQRSLDLKELAALNTEIVQNDADMAKLQGQRLTLLQSSDKMPDLVEKEQVSISNPVLQTINERIATLQVERAKVASHYQPGSEVLKKIDEEIAALQATLAREKATILNTVTTEANPTKRDLRSTLEQQTVQSIGLQDRSKALKVPASQLEQKLREMEKGLDEFEAAEREYRLAEQDYLNYSKRYDEARMSEALDSRRIANVSIAGQPDTPIKPVYPRKVFLMEIGMAVSLLLGLALAAFLETTEDRILDERGVLSLGDVPYLGTVEVGDAA